MNSPRVLVLGGGLAGLATALFLARRGQQVDLLERDRSAVPTGARAAAGWRGDTMFQNAHSHSFPARFGQLLAAEAPDVLDRLRTAGVREIPLRPSPPRVPGTGTEPGIPVVLGARRSVVEWVLRRAVEREPGVRVHPGAVASGLVETGGRVSGVRVAGGVVDADLVIDATGEGSPVSGWLAEQGRMVPEYASPCGISYYTRFWVLHRSIDPGELNCGHLAGGWFDRYCGLVFPADNGTFSVTFGVLPEDQELSGLRFNQTFAVAAAAVPEIACWVDASVALPISGVAMMTGLENRLRVLAPSGVPVLGGLLGVGDAVCTTNPAYCLGAALGLESALTCALAVLAHRADPAAAAAAADAAQQELLTPWFADAVRQDDVRLAGWRAPQHDPATPVPAADRTAPAPDRDRLAALLRSAGPYPSAVHGVSA